MTKHNCQICLQNIRDGEKYLRITTYDESGNELSTAYYHESCFRDKFMTQKKLESAAHSMIGKANKLIANIGGT